MDGVNRVNQASITSTGIEDEKGIVVDAGAAPVHEVVFTATGHRLDRKQLRRAFRVFHPADSCRNRRALLAPTREKALAEQGVPDRWHLAVDHVEPCAQ